MSFDGNRLKQARIDAHVSVQEISTILEDKGIKAKRNTIYSWENGNSQPTPDALLTMCERYNISDPLVYFGYLNDNTASDLSSKEIQIALAYRNASAKDKEVVETVLKEYLDAEQEKTVSAG